MMSLSKQDTAKNAFEYGYYIPKYEDRAMYFEKSPATLKKGTVLGNTQDLPPQVPVLRELSGGAVYLCKVPSVKRARVRPGLLFWQILSCDMEASGDPCGPGLQNFQ